MIARFSDNRSLASAYTELIELGIPKSCITPCFEEAGAEPLAPEAHRSFLEQLYNWQSRHSIVTESKDCADAMPASPAFRNHGGVLDVKCGTQYMQALDVALKFDAVLVG